jgi:hypothetical protein
MPVRHDLSDLTVVDLIRHTRVADATPIVSTVGALDARALPHGARLLLLLSSFETNAANTGGTWAIEDAATSAGSYAAMATQSGDSLAVAADLTTVQTRRRSVQPTAARPFIRVTFTGTDAAAEVDITAHAVVLPAGYVG